MPYEELTKGRVSIAGQLYVVTAASYKRRPVFAGFDCSRILVNTLREAHELGHVNSLCWVVMPDHLHWLFELKPGYRLWDVMRLVKGRSAKRINEYLSCKGKLWQVGYYDHALR